MNTIKTQLDLEFGAVYSKDSTMFRTWSTMAEEVTLVVYCNEKDNIGQTYKMNSIENGIWELQLEGDCHGKYYNYRVLLNGKETETPDPYVKSANANGERGMVVDFSRLNPEGWEEQRKVSTKMSEAVLYELHMRDFSTHEESGIANKGVFLSLTEDNTTTTTGMTTGLAHLEELGVTHVHLLPVYDFTSVDEKNGGYNWGYDPYLYNVLEGSYSSNPDNGEVRIKEFKSLVQSLHNKGIGVILDVVYNHTSHEKQSPFDVLMPGYYYRQTPEGWYSNGSGCGNELATEKPEVRRFIIDSLKFWLQEYKVDGFRFDLMALYDVNTVREIEKELKEINPNVILYGEPWIGGLSVLEEGRRFLKGKQWGTTVGLFNDEIRDTIKGDNDGYERGFVMGRHGMEDKVRVGIAGGIQYSDWLRGFSQNPAETINYVSCHDNLALFDKIKQTCPDYSAEDRRRMNRLALSVILTSFGIPFLHAGSEFLRHKFGQHNSYNAGDYINQMNWSLKHQNEDIYSYIRDLIRFRKDQKVFSTSNANHVREQLEFIPSGLGTVCYKLTSIHEEDYREILIVHNGNNYGSHIQFLPNEEWLLIANGDKVELEGQGIVKDYIVVEPISTCILVKE